MAAFAILCGVLFSLNAAGLPHRRLALPLGRRLLRDSAMFIVLGASALFHADAVPNTDGSHALAAAAGFLMWVAGVALLLLLLALKSRGSARGSSGSGLLLAGGPKHSYAQGQDPIDFPIAHLNMSACMLALDMLFLVLN